MKTVMEPTIELNHRSYPYREGATVSSVMEENNFDFSDIIVKINGTKIEKEAWPVTPISAGDKVEMIHLFSGG